MNTKKCGYIFKDEKGKKFLVRCPSCGRENYAPNVASGVCSWCGFDANVEDKTCENN